MVTLARRAQHIPFAPVVAVLFGGAAAVLVGAVPQWMFESAVVASRLPTVLAAAAPPLGLVARILAIALAFAAVASLTGILVSLATRVLEAKARARTPWRDAGYDVGIDLSRSEKLPPRRPIFAPDELGAPLMSDEAIAAPPAVFDIEPELAAPVVFEHAEAAVVPPVYPDTSIAALIRRLEEGLARRAANDPEPDGPGHGEMPLSRSWIVPENVENTREADDDKTLRQALGTLRRMARG
jgi:hypothetical protein